VVSFHWDCRVVPETRWAFPFYNRALKNLARRTDIQLLGHSHPRARRQLVPFWRSLGVEFIEDFDDVLDVADVYVADATSTIYEAAAVGIPVVVLNSPLYRRDVEHGLRFWEAAQVGPNCDSARELHSKIFESIDPTEQQVKETERCLDLVYTLRDGSSSKAAVEVIRTHVL
jgi:CDP-glycerol glycerophosphotransferase (TagB/SpsB family)